MHGSAVYVRSWWRAGPVDSVGSGESDRHVRFFCCELFNPCTEGSFLSPPRDALT